MYKALLTRALLILGLVLLCGVASANADQGVSDAEIVIGITGSTSGPSAAKGIATKAAISAYFDKVNRGGGVGGRKLRLVALDDGNEPDRAVNNLKRLWERDKVFALIGGNGTPSAKAMLPYVQANDVPMLFFNTGGEFLYKPVIKNVFQLRVPYQTEAELLTRLAVKKLGFKKIGILKQDDAFGTSGLTGVAKALTELGQKVVATGSYRRNTADIEAAVTLLAAANPDAVFLQSVLQATEAFLKRAQAVGLKATFLASSAASAKTVVADLGPSGVGDLYDSEVVPLPTDTGYPLVRQFQAEVKGTPAEGDATGFEGYVDAVVLVESLKRVGKDLTRAKLYETLEEFRDVDVGGLSVSFSADNHAGLKRNWIYHFADGKPVEVK